MQPSATPALSRLLFFAFGMPFILVINYGKAQNTSYNQFWNEIQFTHPFAQGYALEIDLGSSFSNTPEQRSRLAVFTQFVSTVQLHHFYTAKWKFSCMGAYFSNSYVPEIGQREYPEIRLSAQAMYYFNKIKNITLTRGRIEYRIIENSNAEFENVLRYRQMFKFTKPLNSNYIRAGTFFAFVSEEVFIKTPADITGPDVFDRNMLTLGVGYSFTDDLQMDVDYTNEFAPRTTGNLMYHAVQFNLTLNNPFGNIEKIFQPVIKH
jgi:hypothetical protein